MKKKELLCSYPYLTTTAPALHVVLHLEPLRRRVHDYAGGTLDSVIMLVIDHGRFLLQEPVSSPSDLLLDGPKVFNIGTRADLVSRSRWGKKIRDRIFFPHLDLLTRSALVPMLKTLVPELI